ncbi:MAG TPA: hypothetical protein PLJ84_11695, partial [Bacteroidales bacterium]|nr:hypothetical protein [Bacteroidales bacterium]
MVNIPETTDVSSSFTTWLLMLSIESLYLPSQLPFLVNLPVSRSVAGFGYNTNKFGLDSSVLFLTSV